MSNTNWKILGRNSGNMSSHRNVKASKLNYEDLKKAHTETVVPVTEEDFLKKDTCSILCYYV